MLHFVNLTEEIVRDWDQVVYHSADSWAFHLAGWVQAMASVWKRPCHSFAAIESGRMMAVMPLGFIPETNVLASGGWTHGGPVVRGDVSGTDYRRLWRLMLEHGVELARALGAREFSVSLPPLSQTSLCNRWGVNPLLDYGFTDVSTHTWMVDLGKTVDELWADLNNSRNIKKCRSLGYTVAKCRWADVFDSFCAIHRVTYERNGLPPHNEANFRPLADSFEPAGHSHIWVCLDREKCPVGYHAATLFHQTGYYHAGCVLSDRLQDGVNPLLFWTAMTELRALGCRWYDFGEAHPLGTGKAKQLSDFKKKFGSEMHRWFKGQMILAAGAMSVPPPQPGPRTLGTRLRSFLSRLPSRLFRKSA